MLEYEYVINLLKLSEVVAGQMVEAIGRLAKSNKMSGWNIPKKISIKLLTSWKIPIRIRV